jgi:uncharacterized protein (DUF58 family)
VAVVTGWNIAYATAASFGIVLTLLLVLGFLVDVARAAWSVARTLIRSRRAWRQVAGAPCEAGMPVGRMSPCGRRDCPNPHPYRPWVERDPRAGLW